MATKVIKNPRITEKGSYASEQNVYTFDVSADANKTEVKKEIFALYKVRPVKVNILAIPKKKVFARGRGGIGSKGGGKKAFVYLEKGDKIEFI